MSKCPFWSTTREIVECYRECPICESLEAKEGEECIFNNCTESRNVNFTSVIKEDYSFLKLSMYDDELTMNINY
jgi:hypothetical protein